MANLFDSVSIWRQTVIQSCMYLGRLLCQPGKNRWQKLKHGGNVYNALCFTSSIEESFKK